MDLQHAYSYAASFEDGTIIEMDRNNPDDDLSRTGETGNRYTDIVKKQKEVKLISFVLYNDDFQAGVDLRDGHFEVNGVLFFQHRQDLTPYKDFRLIYYRTVERNFNSNNEEMSANIIGYGLGWQTNDSDGNNVQKFIFI